MILTFDSRQLLTLGLRWEDGKTIFCLFGVLLVRLPRCQRCGALAERRTAGGVWACGEHYLELM